MERTEVNLARVYDLARFSERDQAIEATHFLGVSEQAALMSALKKDGQHPESKRIAGVRYCLYAPVANAEARMLVFLPDWLEEESFLAQEASDPTLIGCLFIRPKNEKFSLPLRHQDYLGAMMGLGIERNRIGDIYLDEKEGYVFLEKGLVPLAVESIKSVGPVNVNVSEINPSECPLKPRYEQIRGSVSSLRLDSLIAFAFRLSREEAKHLVESGNVTVSENSRPKADAEVKEGERISVRGHGKAIFQGVDGSSRKGKPVIVLEVGTLKR